MKFIHCPICENYHPPKFAGDCRDNDNRFTIEQIDLMRDRVAATGSRKTIVTEYAK